VLRESAPFSFPLGAWKGISRASGWTIFGLGFVLALILALPGETVTTRLLEDLFATLDGVHRLAWGQVPSRDFHSPVGPLAYYIPGLGFWLTGSFGAALPLGMGILTVLMGALLAHILPSRLHPALALPFALFLLIILAVPMNLGDAVTALSFAQFYNRVGWVALAALLVLFLTPRDKGRADWRLDAAFATALTLLLIYTRATYGIVALAFLVFMLTDNRQRRWAAVALGGTIIVAGLVELVWRGSLTYLADSLQAFAAGGYLRGTPVQRLEHFLGNLADYILLALLAGLLFWRNFRLRDLAFVLLCGVAGFWLINQNDQRWGILAIHAAAAVLAERLLRDMTGPPSQPMGPVVNPAGVQLYFFAFLFPTMVHCTIALFLHAGTAVINGGQALALPRLEAVRLADLWTAGEFGGSNWYLDLVRDGLIGLEGLESDPGRIAVLGGPNPNPLILDSAPPAGDVAQMRWGATHNVAEHLAPEEMLGGVDTVMERLAAGGIGDLGAVYLPYVQDNFEVRATTRDWRIYGRAADAEPGGQ